jgi:hypothetical protein
MLDEFKRFFSQTAVLPNGLEINIYIVEFLIFSIDTRGVLTWIPFSRRYETEAGQEVVFIGDGRAKIITEKGEIEI